MDKQKRLEIDKKRYHKNREIILKRKKDYYERNKEEIKRKVKDRAITHKEEKKIYDKIYRQEHKKQRYEKSLEYNKEYNKTSRPRFHTGKGNAKQRNLEFTLDFEFYCNLISNPCYYCGCSLEEEKGFSVDRINNSVGYTKENSLPCCGRCNVLRGPFLGVQEFKFVMSLLVPIINSKEYVEPLIFTPTKFKGTKSFWGRYPKAVATLNIKFSQLKQRSRRSEIPLSLTKDDFSKLMAKCCSYCGESLKYTNGVCLDRLNNSLGYIEGNVTPCCGTCNKIRSNILTPNQMLLFIKFLKKFRSK